MGASKVHSPDNNSHDLCNGHRLGTQSLLVYQTVKALHILLVSKAAQVLHKKRRKALFVPDHGGHSVSRDAAHAREIQVGLLQPVCDYLAHIGASGGTAEGDEPDELLKDDEIIPAAAEEDGKLSRVLDVSRLVQGGDGEEASRLIHVLRGALDIGGHLYATGQGLGRQADGLKLT
ncbi:Hypothetical predicted protein [Octopus vulgaris]|uniref:Uncharacterized protein n=1 Tax=Octopus vulgaris TaxID=6645 RepID=A0AA36AIM6_OCTVU|nr:Hypothetical predicted protein [Octopus vulgaris]